jgi:hypothetical protein
MGKRRQGVFKFRPLSDIGFDGMTVLKNPLIPFCGKLSFSPHPEIAFFDLDSEGDPLI